MDAVLQNQSVVRIKQVMQELGVMGEVKVLSESARTAAEAAAALGVTAGQIASSIVFKLPSGNPLLVITSGAHRVDANLVAKNIGVEKLHRADADFVKNASGISIGGVSPLGWISKPEIILIDQALNGYEVVWAAAGHPHAVYPTSFSELIECTNAKPMVVGG